MDVPWPKNGEIDIMDAFQGAPWVAGDQLLGMANSALPGMLKASVIHADETGDASNAIFHGAAKKLNAEASSKRDGRCLEFVFGKSWKKVGPTKLFKLVSIQQPMNLQLRRRRPAKLCWRQCYHAAPVIQYFKLFYNIL